MRETAVFILQDILKNKNFFTQKEDAFVNMLILTSLRHLVFIKKTLKQFAKKKLPSSVSIAEYALILAATEILYLDSPDYAVLNSYVDITKKHTDKYVSGFINAVLRNICKNKEEILSKDSGEFFPAEFFRILQSSYSKKDIQQIQKSCQQEPALDITLKTGAKVNIDGERLDDSTIRILDKVKIKDLDGYDEGKWWVQDYAASMAVKTLGDIKDKTALDICAAPGGKTAQLIDKGAKVTALDISAERLKTLEENLNRLQMKTEETICMDGVEFLKTTDKKFDIILLDAPCSATGTIRRHPEIVHIKSQKDIEKQVGVQKEFLNNIEKALNPDGILLYCVCSISKFEGEKQIHDFLDHNPNFKPLEEIRTLPIGMDSFYIAKLQKIES